MLRNLIFCVLMTGFAGLSAAPMNQNDDQGVRDLVQSFEVAWNAHNPNEMAILWVEDGDLIDPWGNVASDRDGILKLFTQDQQGRFKDSKMEQNVEKVRFINPDLAFLDVEASLTGVAGDDGQQLPPIDHHVIFLLSKENGEWKILAARPYLLPGPKNEVH